MSDKISHATDENMSGLRTAQLSINSGLAAPSHETLSRDDAAKPELTDSCTLHSPALFLSNATFCYTYRHSLSVLAKTCSIR